MVQCTSLTAAELVHRSLHKTPLEPVPCETGLTPWLQPPHDDGDFPSATYESGPKRFTRKLSATVESALPSAYFFSSRFYTVDVATAVNIGGAQGRSIKSDSPDRIKSAPLARYRINAARGTHSNAIVPRHLAESVAKGGYRRMDGRSPTVGCTSRPRFSPLSRVCRPFDVHEYREILVLPACLPGRSVESERSRNHSRGYDN